MLSGIIVVNYLRKMSKNRHTVWNFASEGFAALTMWHQLSPSHMQCWGHRVSGLVKTLSNMFISSNKKDTWELLIQRLRYCKLKGYTQYDLLEWSVFFSSTGFKGGFYQYSVLTTLRPPLVPDYFSTHYSYIYQFPVLSFLRYP